MNRSHLSNAVYNALEYMAQPLSLLVAAPILLHRLGVAPFGLWLFASAVAGAGTMVSTGAGDAIVQRIADLTTRGDEASVHCAIRTMLVINLVLGAGAGAVLWVTAPLLVGRVTHHDPQLYVACLWSMRLSAPLIVIKAVENVFVSAQKARQLYGPTVRIVLAMRLFTIAACVGLAVAGRGVIALMAATVLLSALGAVAQWVAVRGSIGAAPSGVGFDAAMARQLFAYGRFTWLQALAGIIFSQADRIILGTTLGPAAIAYYGVSVQLAQPLHGLTAAGLHVLFPYLASQPAHGSRAGLRKPVRRAFAANLFSAAILTSGVLYLGPKVLAYWMGMEFASHADGLLRLIAVGFGVLALNVTAHYTLMALGYVRLVTMANLAGGALMLATMVVLVPSHGVMGAAAARLWYGPVTCLLYVPLLTLLRTTAPVAVRMGRTELEGA